MCNLPFSGNSSSITFIKINQKLINKKIFESHNTVSNKNIDYLCLVLIIFSIIEFYSLDYNNFLGPIDVHHEGTFLTAQLNFFCKNQMWAGTFYDYGFLGNSIGIFFNSLFDGYSIGIQRFIFKFLSSTSEAISIKYLELKLIFKFSELKSAFIFSLPSPELALFTES